ncbi:metalloproteinase, extracellular matrix glycoprotein VMP17, partial [Volvox carteri f. nagariensis]
PAIGTVNQRLLAIILDYSDCNLRASMDESSLRKIFLGPDGDGRGGIAKQLTQCSYGKFNLNATAFKVITVNICVWAGLGILPGSQTWLLWHSWQNGWEYEDYSTCMGRGDVCPNAPELAYLGWATPAAYGDRIDSEALPVGFELPATYLSPDGNYLRVVPDWLPSYSNKSEAKNLYIGVRVNKNGDAALSSFYAGKVNIHQLNATLDRTISFVSTITPLSRAILSTYNLVVYGGSWVGGKDI